MIDEIEYAFIDYKDGKYWAYTDKEIIELDIIYDTDYFADGYTITLTSDGYTNDTNNSTK